MQEMEDIRQTQQMDQAERWPALPYQSVNVIIQWRSFLTSI